MRFLILRPDGGREHRDLPEDPARRLEVLQAAVGGGLEVLSPAWHGLQNYDVVINDDGLDRLPENAFGCRLIGYDLSQYAPLCGPLVLLPREDRASGERAQHAHFFAQLERVARGELSPQALGYDVVIDARED